MKTLLVLTSLFSFAAFAAPATKIVECKVHIDKRGETLRLKIDANDKLTFFSSKKIVDAAKDSHFGFLADLENFGLEGSSSIVARNGYRILSVINTAESVDIGVSEDYTRGFYYYRDGGSGLGNLKLDLNCKLK